MLTNSLATNHRAISPAKGSHTCSKLPDHAEGAEILGTLLAGTISETHN
jgi:hypothetical protein